MSILTTPRGFAPIELKDAEGDPADIVTKALNDLQGSLDERLAALEAKQAGRLDKLEARLNRPGLGTDAPANLEGSISRKAFDRYLRAGQAAMMADEVKTLTVANDAQGGFLAPQEVGAELIKLLRQFSPVRAYARVISIGAESIKYPRRVGSTAATWVDEIEERTPSEPTFEQITLTPHELATYTDVSNKLLEDNAYNLEGELIADMAESFGKAEGQAFISGTGNKQPKGLLTAAGIETMTTGDADGFPDENPADVLIRMFHALPTVHAQNAVWLMNRHTLGNMRLWKDGTGRHLLVEPITAGMPTTLLGRPVVEMVDMPSVAPGAFPVLFGDLQGYRIVDRVGFATLRDPYTLATVGQTRFHARKRVGADITHPDRFVKLKVAA